MISLVILSALEPLLEPLRELLKMAEGVIDKISQALMTINRYINDLIEKNVGGFLLSQLEFLHKGGRCSSVSLLGANLLNIKPTIVVKDGAMTVAKKYRGKDEACRLKFLKDRLDEYKDVIDTRRIVLHMTCDISEKDRKYYKKELRKLIDCDEIIVSTAGCVITSHCGPGTFALFFMTK